MPKRRRGLVLVLVLLSLALVAAVLLPLARLSGVEALKTSQAGCALRQRIAAESLVALVPQLLAKDAGVRGALDHGNLARYDWDLGPVHLLVLIQDDSAKLPAALASPAALQMLGAECDLPGLIPRVSDPARTSPDSWATGCLEDLFETTTDAAIYGTTGATPAWCRFLTPTGQRIHLARAPTPVLSAALQAFGSGLGLQLRRAWDSAANPDVNACVAHLELPAAAARRVVELFSDHAERYSLLVRTAIGDDVRQRYLICSADTPPVVLVNWEVAP